jgi:flagellar M-ring protein FliF
MGEDDRGIVQQSLRMFQTIPPAKRLSFAVIISLVAGGFVALILWTNRPDYQVLFSNLETADASRISERLKEQRIPLQLKEGGRTILVPEEKVYELRLELASQGLPKGRNVGFEVFDDLPFGTTEFVQRLKFRQALEGELARTITGFDAVSEARVHIVTSNDSLFVEPEKHSTASVVLRLNPNRALDRRQLQGIVNLMACAVEGLKPENVTVVDMEGGLLSKGSDIDNVGSISGTQFDYRKKIEQDLENRIRTMLEPVVGPNKVVARVSADVDFRQINISEERYDPDSAVVRSEQHQKEAASGGKGLPAGSPDLKYEIYQTQGATESASKNFNKENAVINYEINRVNKQVISSVGDIKRLSGAVIIDGPYVSEKDAEGNDILKFSPRSRREMKGFEDVVKKAMGFEETRGDQVMVSNVPFAIDKERRAPSESPSIWFDYAKRGVKPALNLGLILLFFLFAVRPFRKWLRQTREQIGPQALPVGRDVPRLESATGDGSSGVIHKEQILDVSKTEPEKIAAVVRGWIREGS